MHNFIQCILHNSFLIHNTVSVTNLDVPSALGHQRVLHSHMPMLVSCESRQTDALTAYRTFSPLLLLTDARQYMHTLNTTACRNHDHLRHYQRVSMMCGIVRLRDIPHHYDAAAFVESSTGNKSSILELRLFKTNPMEDGNLVLPVYSQRTMNAICH